MPPPLHGLTVLDFSTLLPGPLATLMLAEAGAEVVKIERPGGDDMRRFPPEFGPGSAAYAALNGGKKSVVADLKTEEGRRRLEPLLARADILVEQFRPGVMDRLGLGYEALRRINPRLIYCSISGYGQAGRRAQEAGHDINYQAVTGLLSLAPAMPAALVADIAGGAMPAVMNILLALRVRDSTGLGSHLDIAMADAMFTFAWFGLAQGHATGRFPGENMLAGGSPRYGLYETADGHFLAVGALEQKFWDTLCEAIGLPSALRDERQDPAATRRALAELIRAQPGEHWRKLLEPADCCCTVVASLEEAIEDEHFRTRGLFRYSVEQGGRRMPMTVLPLAPGFRRPPEGDRQVAPLGQEPAAREGRTP
ncbi:MAG TPA: CaiB/BaiF CoA-transferase family protein [Microvirga sp.]|nr:CaiB/BaiF CoA-transferase family protein [Microvirga sp.]